MKVVVSRGGPILSALSQKKYIICIYTETMYIFMCIGELAVILVLRCTQEVDVTLDPSHVYECGLEDQSGKQERTQLMIAVLMVRRINILTDLLDID